MYWNAFGTRHELQSGLARITEVNEDILSETASLSSASVVRRMSWAARRETTKEEDLAYYLLGIFDVHMSLPYGERLEQAYLRLQEEIMKRNGDHSLFAWLPADAVTSVPVNELAPLTDPLRAVLAFARHPRNFAAAGHIRRCESSWQEASTNASEAMKIVLPLFVAPRLHFSWLEWFKDAFRTEAGALYIIVLSCTTDDDIYNQKRCALVVRHITQD